MEISKFTENYELRKKAVADQIHGKHVIHANKWIHVKLWITEKWIRGFNSQKLVNSWKFSE